MSTIDTAAAPLARAVPWSRAAQAAALATVLVYLPVLVLRLGSVLTAAYQDSDAASGPVVGESAATLAGHQHVLLGHIAWYPQLWAYELTAALPGRDVIWLAAPLLFALVAIAAVALTTARLAGRWAGLFVVAAVGCAGPAMLNQLVRPTQHETTYFAACLLGACLVAIVRRPPRTPVAVAAFIACAGVMTGLFVSADRLLLIAGLVPFLAGAALVAAKRPGTAARHTLAITVGVAAVAVIVAGVTPHIAAWMGVAAIPLPVHVAAYDEIPGHASLLVRGVLTLGNAAVLPWLAPLVLGAVVWPLIAARRALAVEAPAAGDEPRLAWTAFWGVSAALVIGAWMLSDVVVDIESARYLPTLLFGGAAVAPLALSRRRAGIALALAAATLAAAGSTYALARGVPQQRGLPTTTDVDRLAAIAQRTGLRYGYGGYWAASNVTWMSRFKLRVAPVIGCGVGLCPLGLHHVASWYTPRPHTRTFILAGPTPQGPAAEPPPVFGRPLHAWRAGTLTMYAFDYDVAAHFGLAPRGQSTGR
jgi:hypothetical protein